MSASGLSKTSSSGEQSAFSMFNAFGKTETASPRKLLPSVDEQDLPDSSDDDIEEVTAKIFIANSTSEKLDNSRDGDSGVSLKSARSTGSQLPSLRMKSLRERSSSSEKQDESRSHHESKSKSDEQGIQSISHDEIRNHNETKTKSDDEGITCISQNGSGNLTSNGTKLKKEDSGTKFIRALNQTKSKSLDSSLKPISQGSSGSLSQGKSKSDEKGVQSNITETTQVEHGNQVDGVNSDVRSMTWVSNLKAGSQSDTKGQTEVNEKTTDDFVNVSLNANYPFGCCGNLS